MYPVVNSPKGLRESDGTMTKHSTRHIVCVYIYHIYMWYIYNFILKKQILTHVATWMNTENTMLFEITQTQKRTNRSILWSHLYEILVRQTITLTLTLTLEDQIVKNPHTMQETLFNCWVKIPWGRAWKPTPVFLPEKSHRQRSLAGYSPWGRKESDMTQQLTLSLLFIETEIRLEVIKG